MKLKNSHWWLIGVGAVIVILLLSFWGMHSGLVNADENVNQKWGNVQTAYQRRADLIPNLVETVKGFRNHEAATLTKITELRSEAGQAKVNIDAATNPAEIEAAMGSMNSVLSRLLVIVEQYPDLKANENFLSLQDELAGTENRIKVERDGFNEAVKNYNLKIRKFPSNIVAGMFGFGLKTMFEAEAGSEVAPQVGF